RVGGLREEGAAGGGDGLPEGGVLGVEAGPHVVERRHHVRRVGERRGRGGGVGHEHDQVGGGIEHAGDAGRLRVGRLALVHHHVEQRARLGGVVEVAGAVPPARRREDQRGREVRLAVGRWVGGGGDGRARGGAVPGEVAGHAAGRL